MTQHWAGEDGVVRLPGGALVRGRRLGETPSPADFTLVLGKGARPPWSNRCVEWRDFGLPRRTEDVLEGLREVRARAVAGERVEVACAGGVGRTGTALAALAVLDGMEPSAAVRWVRSVYHRRAVETPWQRWWLRHVCSRGYTLVRGEHGGGTCR